MRHSLHWKPRQAPFFYGLYAGLVGLSAIVTLAWGNDLGVVIDGVEALNGILLPSTLVFLVLLANDKAVLGPWTNSPAQNWVSGVIVWAVTTFSLAPLVTTFFPNVTLTQCLYAFIVCTAAGLAAGAILCRLRPCPAPAGQPGTRTATSVRPGMSRYEWREVLRTRRAEWRTPRLDTLQRPVFSMLAQDRPTHPPRLHSLRDRDHGDQARRGHRPLAQPHAGATPLRSRAGHSSFRAWYSLRCRGEQKKITRSLS